jgi:hypothetical protein
MQAYCAGRALNWPVLYSFGKEMVDRGTNIIQWLPEARADGHLRM